VVVVFIISGLVLFKDRLYVSLQKVRYSHSVVKTELISQPFIDKIVSRGDNFESNASFGVWNSKQIFVPSNSIAEVLYQPLTSVLGDFSGEKWIEVKLTTQHLYAHQGDRIAFDFPISSSLPWTPTVTGEFYVWAKVRSQRMTGGQNRWHLL
jgi:hypothetical protein